MKTPLLFLCHRMPFPPNKGDKIATFNLMKYLSKRFDLYLGCFIDDEFDFQYKDEVAKYCKETCFIDISSKRYIVSGIRSLVARTPVSVEHYKSASLQKWVDHVVAANDIDYLFAYCSSVAQFITPARFANKKRVLDMCDVDSDKWRQYCENKPLHSKLIYGREYRLLSDYEQFLLRELDGITLVTDEERELFRKLSPQSYSEKISTLSNGVDIAYFSPDAEYDYTDQPQCDGPSICFTGAMDYWANEDAVVWFAEHVWPELSKACPNLTFYIVGGNPSERVKDIANLENVIVTGRVVDVRPFIAHATVCVATLRIARGVQNKVLEAMAMNKPVVMTSMAQEGIALPLSQQSFVQDTPSAVLSAIKQLLESPELAYSVGKENRGWIETHYSWDGALKPLDTIFPSDTL